MNQDIDTFLVMYLNLKRAVMKNPYIKLKNDRTQLEEQATQVLDKLKELHADTIDFLQFMCKYYAPMRIFPSLRHILNVKAINKYRYHQAMTNKYIYDYVSFDRDNVFIHESLETVSWKDDFTRPIDQDIRLKYAIHMSKNNTTDHIYSVKERNDVIYALTKLRFFEKPIPDELLQLKEKLDANFKM